MRPERLRLAFLLSAGSLAAWAVGCAKPAETIELQGRAMGSTYHIRIARARLTAGQRDKLRAEVDARLAGLEKLLSLYDPESELARFNRSRRVRPFPVSPETVELARAALRFSRESGGAYDPTVAPLVDLWGFGPSHSKAYPSDAEIAAALKRVGARHLRLRDDPPALIKDIPDLELDLNSVADSHAADAVSKLLSGAGLADFMVEVGGEIFARGKNAQAEPWQIGIDLPAEGSTPGRDLSAVVPLSGEGLTTSGSYRKFFRKDGKRYSHIIDPRTGRAVTHALASVTVIAPTCMEANGASTAVMALGPSAGLDWLKKKGLPALLITADEDGTFSLRRTAGFP